MKNRNAFRKAFVVVCMLISIGTILFDMQQNSSGHMEICLLFH